MTSTLEVQDEAKIKEVAEQYRRDGYEVILAPDPSRLPFDLGEYRPDLIARKEGQGFIVEVKTNAKRISLDRLRTIAEEVRRHRGWRFVLVTAQDVTSEVFPGEDGDQPSWAEIDQRTNHAARLIEQGDTEAAYLVLWIAFERMLRLQARLIALPVERLGPSVMIRQLYSLGELSIEQFETALACQQMRNRVVHGFSGQDLAGATEQL